MIRKIMMGAVPQIVVSYNVVMLVFPGLPLPLLVLCMFLAKIGCDCVVSDHVVCDGPL